MRRAWPAARRVAHLRSSPARARSAASSALGEEADEVGEQVVPLRALARHARELELEPVDPLDLGRQVVSALETEGFDAQGAGAGAPETRLVEDLVRPKLRFIAHGVIPS